MLDIFVNCTISSTRIKLKPYSTIDDLRLYKIANNPDVYKYLPDKGISLEGIRNLIQWSIACNSKNTRDSIYKFNLSIYLEKELIGWCGLGPCDIDPNTVELYYALDPQYWGLGLASEAANALVNFAVKELDITQITATVAPQNTASVIILEKIGFKFIRNIDSQLDDHINSYFKGNAFYCLDINNTKEQN
jgi:ribosomal-protein-alanine N-acetyltransferase